MAMNPDAVGGRNILQDLKQDAGVVFDGAFQMLDRHFPGGRLGTGTADGDVIIAAGEQNQFGVRCLIGLGEVTVVFQKTMDPDDRMPRAGTVITNRDSAFTDRVYASGEHLRIGLLNRFDQFAGMDCFHLTSSPVAGDCQVWSQPRSGAKRTSCRDLCTQSTCFLVYLCQKTRHKSTDPNRNEFSVLL